MFSFSLKPLNKLLTLFLFASLFTPTKNKGALPFLSYVKKAKQYVSKHVSSIFQKKSHHQTTTSTTCKNVQGHTFYITGKCGSISIKGDPDRKQAVIVSTKKTLTSFALDKIKPVIKKDGSKKNVYIQTAIPDDYPDETIVEYTIIVPEESNLNIKIDCGDIMIKDINGSVQTETHSGTTTLINIKNNVNAVCKKGNIYAYEIQNAITIQITEQGTITLHEINGPIHAQTTKGNIALETSKSIKRIHLGCIQAGNISLIIPEQSASFRMKTEQGKIKSKIMIMTKMFLDNASVKKLRRSIQGTFVGPKNDSNTKITVYTKSGSINVEPYKPYIDATSEGKTFAWMR